MHRVDTAFSYSLTKPVSQNNDDANKKQNKEKAKTRGITTIGMVGLDRNWLMSKAKFHLKNYVCSHPECNVDLGIVENLKKDEMGYYVYYHERLEDNETMGGIIHDGICAACYKKIKSSEGRSTRARK